MANAQQKSKLFESICSGKLEEAIQTINKDLSLLATADEKGRFLVHWAVIKDNLSLLKFIIFIDRSQTNKAGNRGATPLMEVALRNYLRLPLFRGKLKIAEYLLSLPECDVNAIGFCGQTTLHTAVSKSDTKLAELLLTNGANTKQEDTDGMTVIHLAASNRNLSMITLLVNYGVTVNQTDRSCQTPVHIAVCINSIPTVKHLALQGANLDQGDLNGYTPLHLALEKKYIAMIKFLLEIGANEKQKDHKGITPLVIGATSRNNRIKRLFNQKPQNPAVSNAINAVKLMAIVSS